MAFCGLVPEQRLYAAEKVLSPHGRPYGQPNLWMGENGFPAVLTLTAKQPVKAGHLAFTFDTDLTKEPLDGLPGCLARDFDVTVTCRDASGERSDIRQVPGQSKTACDVCAGRGGDPAGKAFHPEKLGRGCGRSIRGSFLVIGTGRRAASGRQKNGGTTMYRVIIADDEPLIRAGLYYRNDWNAMGFEVAALLEDGSDVLKLLEKERADVLLTDICMFQVSGLEAAGQIREKYPWMKVVLLSGYREFEYAREAMRCQVYEYLLKPIDYES